ncbi:MAG: lipoprotein-releasing ABC transporter permease subunit [bacterium]
MPYELLIGLRYLRAKRKQTVISVISIISICGVALGVMALIIVLAVMSGFEMDLRDKILGTNSHIVVLEYNGQGIENGAELMSKILKIKGVTSCAPFIYGQVMLSSSQSASGLVLRGIDPKEETHVTDLARNIVAGDLHELVAPQSQGQGRDEDTPTPQMAGVALGQELARNLGVFVGDVITAISPVERISPMGLTPKFLRFKVVAIFNSGMYEYDTSLAYVSLRTAQRLFNMKNTVTGIEVKVANIFQAQDISRDIQKALGFPYWTRDWMEMNKNLFSALKLEKFAMFIILVLIILVAAFNIISTLVMMVMEKNKDIAILKSMGATARSILFIFIAEGLIIGLLGTLIGCLGGTFACWIADTYHLIKLQGDVYYISYLPFKMKFLDVFAVCFSSILISFLATMYPAWQASKLDPVVSLRYE